MYTTDPRELTEEKSTFRWRRIEEILACLQNSDNLEDMILNSEILIILLQTELLYRRLRNSEKTIDGKVSEDVGE